ncbi:HlyD family secretion protein [Croceicoccus mobilis]|uniref:Membrane protein n=1 Tax=Croceicoccus mobilis TaxID=1703339 RepID=A0A916YPX2_9SPHN|nr:HlyD family secretion protein [Croceicoccus mobilis]GGD55525.1 membrane protein [Croceicoccus mobilis]
MAEADPQFPAENSTMSENEAQAEAPRRKILRRVLTIVIPVLIAAGIGAWWFMGQGTISTDNAFIKQDMVSVSAEVGGRVTEIYAKDGQQVKAGDPLFQIDKEPYELAIADARAALARAQANVSTLSNSADLSGADIAAAREDIAFAQSRFNRQQALMDKGFTTRADYDAAQHAVQQAREELRAAQARQTAAQAQLAQGSAVPGENPGVAAAKAQLAQAELNLRRTTVRAPMNGQVSQTDRLQLGAQVVAAVPMLDIVALDSTYVEANFKETDLDTMQPGQPVEVEIDAYPGVALKGHVESIGAGTGSEFSVLPAQNATGNWVKVTQRVPVRIAVDDNSQRKLISGLSASVTVNTED